MDIEVILDRDHGDVQEFGVQSLRFIVFCFIRNNFSDMIWHCNGLCKKKQRAVGEHLVNGKEIKLRSILLLIKCKYVNTFTVGIVRKSFEKCECYSR